MTWFPVTLLTVLLLFFFFRKTLVHYLFIQVLKLTQRTATGLDDKIVQALERPLREFLVVLGVYLILRSLPLNPAYTNFVLKVFRSCIVVLVAWALYIIVESLVAEDLKTRFGANNILVPFVCKAARFVILVLAFMIVAVEWGYDVNGLITGLGLGGLAVALAAKDALSNIFGGIVIILDKPFTIGDWISTPSVEGTVEDITFRSTKIRTFAQALVTVPNATLANEPITNWSRMGKRRITFHLGVTYSTPRHKLEKCVKDIRQMLEEHPEVHKETIFVYFERFGESSLDIFLYFFTKTTKWQEYLSVREDINFKIMEILEREGVSIAFPSRSIYLENAVPNWKVTPEQSPKE